MRFSDTTANRILLLLTAVLVLLLGYLLLSEPTRTNLLRVINRAPKVLYTCPLVSASNAGDAGTCTDCAYYPVSKTHRLSAGYKPFVIPTGLSGGGSLIPEARHALQNLFSLAESSGHSPTITSAYRSYEDQQRVFSGWVFQEWQRSNNILLAIMFAARYSAKPGHSEHQLGTAVDINCESCFPFNVSDPKNLALWKFFEQNAHRFGFVISYPRNMEDRTGYQYEPWHLRYIGTDLATELYEQGYTRGNGTCLLTLLQVNKRY